MNKLFSGANAAIDNNWKTRSWTKTVYFTGKCPEMTSFESKLLTSNDLEESQRQYLSFYNFSIIKCVSGYDSYVSHMNHCLVVPCLTKLFWWLIIMTHFSSRPFRWNHPQARETQTQVQNLRKTKMKKLKLLNADSYLWVINYDSPLWLINDDASNLTMTKQSITNSIYNLNHWYLLSLFTVWFTRHAIRSDIYFVSRIFM